jgi:hypothetical protein
MYQRFANKKVLIIPLNWGLGHATRCVPIIESLLQVNAQVDISGSGISGHYLNKKFNFLSFQEACPDYHISYPEQGVTFTSMLFQWPKMEAAIRAENRWLRKQMMHQKWDFIISDHRFGIYHPAAHNIFVAHQLNPILPWAIKPFFQWSHRKKLKHFQEIWIPDNESPFDLSGSLSKFSGSQVVQRIGWLSRFQNVIAQSFDDFEWVGWVSGPETQRTIFENELQQLFEKSGKRCLLVCGQPHLSFDTTVNGVRRVSHLDEARMKFVIQKAEKCFARSGYSTLMDLKILEANAELYPTPGQTEQIYLAKRWKSFC